MPDQLSDRFRLEVVVVGIVDEDHPVADAEVLIGQTIKATNAEGVTIFDLAYNQTVDIQISAPGWLDTRSVEVDIGNVSESRSNILSDVISAAVCAFSLGGLCLERKAILLHDDSATLTFKLIRPELEANFTITQPAGTVAANAGPVSSTPWRPHTVDFVEDKGNQRFYMMHVQEATVGMVWKNDAPEEGGDFDLGVACAEAESPAEATMEGGDITVLFDEGEHSRTLDYQPPLPPAAGTHVNKGWGSLFIEEEPCKSLLAGPIFHSPNLETTFHFTGSFTFTSRTQVPVVDQ